MHESFYAYLAVLVVASVVAVWWHIRLTECARFENRRQRRQHVRNGTLARLLTTVSANASETSRPVLRWVRTGAGIVREFRLDVTNTCPWPARWDIVVTCRLHWWLPDTRLELPHVSLDTQDDVEHVRQVIEDFYVNHPWRGGSCRLYPS